MNKFLLFIALLFSELVLSQDKPTLENFQKKYRYVKNKNYTGPKGDYRSPSSMDEPDNQFPQSNSSSSSNGGNMDYSPEEIERMREKRQSESQNGSGDSQNSGSYGSGPSGQNGSGIPSDGGRNVNGGKKAKNPLKDVKRKRKPITYNPPNYNAPEMDEPQRSSGMSMFWKVFLITIAAIGVLFLLYIILKNHKPRNKKVSSNSSFDEWNPEVITKTELELRLEKAMLENNYRECVRIYFTFILKEMIRLRLISWKKELTNYDYINQTRSKVLFNEFERTVHIYDLVWYGEYNIDSNDYKSVEKHLEKHYKLLNQTNA